MAAQNASNPDEQPAPDAGTEQSASEPVVAESDLAPDTVAPTAEAAPEPAAETEQPSAPTEPDDMLGEIVIYEHHAGQFQPAIICGVNDDDRTIVHLQVFAPISHFRPNIAQGTGENTWRTL